MGNLSKQLIFSPSLFSIFPGKIMLAPAPASAPSLFFPSSRSWAVSPFIFLLLFLPAEWENASMHIHNTMHEKRNEWYEKRYELPVTVSPFSYNYLVCVVVQTINLTSRFFSPQTASFKWNAKGEERNERRWRRRCSSLITSSSTLLMHSPWKERYYENMTWLETPSWRATLSLSLIIIFSKVGSRNTCII